MLEEVSKASCWWRLKIRSDGIPLQSLDSFEESLRRMLLQKYEKHWFVHEPMKGCGFRSLSYDVVVDPLLLKASEAAGIVDIATRLPRAIMFVNPGQVKVRLLDDRRYWNTSEGYDYETLETSPTKALNIETEQWTEPVSYAEKCRGVVSMAANTSLSVRAH